jgi:uncharacterized protein YndB with AHSA1/START domain
MKRLQFSIDIAAPAQRVWDTMLQPATYREWTAAFCPGSYYEGSWEEGAAIRFLAPSGDGMHSRIAASRPHRFVSIQHLGEIAGGVDKPAGDQWRDAFENYTLTERDGATHLEIAMDVAPDFEAFMQQTWPQALARLKALAERA